MFQSVDFISIHSLALMLRWIFMWRSKTQKAGKLPLSALFTGVPTLKYSPFLFEFAPSQTFYCLIHCIYYFRTGNTRDDVDNVTKQENKVLFCQCKQMPETILSCETFSGGHWQDRSYTRKRTLKGQHGWGISSRGLCYSCLVNASPVICVDGEKVVMEDWSGERKGTYSSGRMEDVWKTREPVLLPSCEANPSGQCGSSIMQFPLKGLWREA